MIRKYFAVTVFLVALLLGGHPFIGHAAGPGPWPPYAATPSPQGILGESGFSTSPERPAIVPHLTESQQSLVPDPNAINKRWMIPSTFDWAITSQETGGADAYGYTWDDTVPFQWEDAYIISGGTKLDLEGDDNYKGLDIGFEFPFYENRYSHLFVSTNGFIAFDSEGAYQFFNKSIPYPGAPNNYIAPFWDDLGVNCCNNQGGVYYKRGGTAPHRYLVIEWFRVSRLWNEETLTFEVILYENGDIVFQYSSMKGDLRWATVGIEDDVGGDGALYLYHTSGITDNKAIRFRRPGPKARLKVWPLFHGRFVAAGEMAYFHIPVHNIGELGADTYEVMVDKTQWPVTLFRADRLTPLRDTNGNGSLDTGAVSQGDQFNLWVGIRTPANATVGAHNEVQLTLRSSRNPQQERTISLRTAIPAEFAQVYSDRSDGAMAYDFVKPAGVIPGKASENHVNGYQLAVAELPDDNFFYAWVVGRRIAENSSIYVSEIYYAIVDGAGNVVHPVTRLTEHSQATKDTYDRAPAIAVTDNGKVGILFTRELHNQDNQQYNRNLFMSVVDIHGNVQVAPRNITQNGKWGTWSELFVASFYSPEMVATENERFVMSWEKFYYGNPNDHCDNYCGVADIWYAVANAEGQLVHPLTQLTQDSPGWDDGYGSPALAQKNNKALLVFERGGEHDDIYYAVIDDHGNVTQNPTPLTSDGSDSGDMNSDVTRLDNGKFVVTWMGQPSKNPGEQGWRASYYNNESLSGVPVLVRNESTIDYGWWDAAPAPGVHRDFFSVRWEGSIPVKEGDYVFYMGSDDGSRLFIDGRKVMDHWDECCVTWTTTVHLSQGTHRVVMEMHEHDGAAWARLAWRQFMGKGNYFIKYAVLDANFHLTGDSGVLPNAATYSGNAYPSVTAAGDRAIITWMDEDWTYRHNLYYALVDGSGQVLTPAMIFRTASQNTASILTSFEGYGNTSYHWQPTFDEDLFLPMTMR